MAFSLRSNRHRRQDDSLSRTRRRASARRPLRPRLERLELRLLLAFTPAYSWPIEVDGSQTSNPSKSIGAFGGQTLAHETIAEEANGDYQVVWNDKNLVGIETRLFSASGAPIGSVVHVATTNDLNDSEATVAMNAAGNSVIAWAHFPNGSESGPSSVELQYFTTSGQGISPVGSPIVIASAFGSGSAYQPSVAYESSDVVVAYTDTNSNGSLSQVKADVIAGSGAPTAFSVSASTTTSQPSVAMNPTNDSFVIAWTQGASAVSQLATGYVQAEQFAGGGTPAGSAFTVYSSLVVENEPSAAMAANGDFVVAFTAFSSSALVSSGLFGSYAVDDTGVDAILYNPQGEVVQSLPVQSYSQSSPVSAYDPSAAMDATGQFVVGYTLGGDYDGGDPNASSPSVEGSAYSNAGVLLQSGLNLAQNMTLYQNSATVPPPDDSIPSVSLSPSGLLAADWQNSGVEGGGEFPGPGVFTQAFATANFAASPVGSNNIAIAGGLPTTFPIDITRDPGFSEPISVSISHLPQGVTYTVSGDNPSAPREVVTVTFNSADGVAPQSLASILSVSDGQGQPETTDVNFSVSRSQITRVSTYLGGAPEVAPYTLVPGQLATIYGSGFVDVSSVQFGAAGPSASATVDPSGDSLTVIVPSSLTAYPSLFGGHIIIHRTGGDDIVSSFAPNYSEGYISSLNDNVTPYETATGYAVQGFAAGYDTNASLGTLLIIKGFGFQPNDVVLFGPQLTPPSGFNPAAPIYYTSSINNNFPGSTAPTTPAEWQATAAAYGTVPTYVDPGGTYMAVYVPEDAVSGSVYVVHPDGQYLTSPVNFQVFSFRNSYAFSIVNAADGIAADGTNDELNGQVTNPDLWDDFNLTQADLEAEFPGALTNVVNYLTSQAQLAAWALALNSNGSCFGLDVTASLLYQEANDPKGIGPATFLGQTGAGAPAGINFSNSVYAPTFSLAWNSTLTMNGLTLPLAQVIHLNLMSQMSVFVTSAVIQQVQEFHNASQADLVSDFINPISSELAAGRPPIIGITLAGHSILAYNVQSDGSGGYYIDCYNPNDPVDSSYTTGGPNSSSGLHQTYPLANDQGAKQLASGPFYAVQTQAGMLAEDNQDRIHVDASGNWNWTQDDGVLFTGNLRGGGLQVLPVNINAVNHNTPFVGPAETMSLPNPGNDVYLDGALIVIATVAPAAAGITVGTVLGVIEIAFSLLDGTSPSTPPATAALPNAATGQSMPLAKTAAAHGSHSARTWWVGSAPGSNFPDIQSAIISPSVHNGDTIKVEPGTYADAQFAGDTVMVDKSLTIIGGEAYPHTNERGASIVTSDGVGFTLEANDIALENFTIRPATLPLGTAGIATASGFSGAGYRIRNDVLEDEANGLQLNTAGGKSSVVKLSRASIRSPRGSVELSRRKVAAAAKHPVKTAIVSVRARVSDRVVITPRENALGGGKSGTSSTISGNTFINNITGIFSDMGMNSVTITANHFQGDTYASVAVTGASPSSNVQILGNQLTSDAPIILQNATNSKIERNNIDDPYGTNGDGIWLNGGVTRTLIELNSLVGNGGSGNGIDSSGAGNASDTISHNKVMDFAKGIRLNSTTGDTILDNTVGRCAAAGIDVSNSSTRNTIKGNSANQNFIGIAMLLANSNAITHNMASGNQNGGIVVLGGNANSISRNTASGNAGGVGILVSGISNAVSHNTADDNAVGVASLLSMKTTISQNAANANSSLGIDVQDDVNAAGQTDQVVSNKAMDNGYGGILFYLSTYVTASKNQANDNTVFGIQVENSGEADTFDTITRNTADGNQGGPGINLINDLDTTVSGNITKGDGMDDLSS